MSTGLATYPVPPQRGQAFGSTHPPQFDEKFFINSGARERKMFFVTKPEQVLEFRPFPRLCHPKKLPDAAHFVRFLHHGLPDFAGECLGELRHVDDDSVDAEARR